MLGVRREPRPEDEAVALALFDVAGFLFAGAMAVSRLTTAIEARREARAAAAPPKVIDVEPEPTRLVDPDDGSDDRVAGAALHVDEYAQASEAEAREHLTYDPDVT